MSWQVWRTSSSKNVTYPESFNSSIRTRFPNSTRYSTSTDKKARTHDPKWSRLVKAHTVRLSTIFVLDLVLSKLRTSILGSLVFLVLNEYFCLFLFSTSVRTSREDKQVAPPPMPKSLSPGPEIEEIKREIVSEIKYHFDSRKTWFFPLLKQKVNFQTGYLENRMP